jgi:hypothetical protein
MQRRFIFCRTRLSQHPGDQDREVRTCGRRAQTPAATKKLRATTLAVQRRTRPAMTVARSRGEHQAQYPPAPPQVMEWVMGKWILPRPAWEKGQPSTAVMALAVTLNHETRRLA